MKSVVGKSADDNWFDVQDEDGIWRVGYKIQNNTLIRLISLDGFHPARNTVILWIKSELLWSLREDTAYQVEDNGIDSAIGQQNYQEIAHFKGDLKCKNRVM